jgi:transcriptional regulator with XRE-family HTH domain
MSSEVGKRIREERQKLGLSQALFAEKAGVHRNTQANYETGRRVPDSLYFIAIRRIGVDIGYVLDGYQVSDTDEIETPLIDLGVSLGRFLDRQQPPSENEALPENTGDIDIDLLSDVLAGVDSALQNNGLAMPSTKKARAVALLYRSFKSAGKVDPVVIAETVRLAAV